MADDGLSLPWLGQVFLNPPYAALHEWMRKAVAEVAAGRARTVLGLIPARIDTRAFQDLVAGRAHVVLLRGRLKFGALGGGDAAPFPSALVAWGGDPGLPGRLRLAFPEAWHVPASDG